MKVRARKDEDHKASAVAKPPPLVLAWNARWAEGESAEGVRDLIGSALSFYDEAHFAAALKLFDQAAELRPDYDLPHHGRALVFAAVGQFVDGIEACKRCINIVNLATGRTAPTYGTGTVFGLLAWLYGHTGELSEAVGAIFRAILAADPAYDNIEWLHRVRSFVFERNEHRLPNNSRIVESNEAGYTDRHGGPVGDAEEISETDIIARVRTMPRDKLPALAKLIDDFERTNGEVGASQPAKEPPRLKWEQDRRDDDNPATFAWRAYTAEAKAGTLHRGVISTEDPALHRKLKNWLRTHDMPEGMDIPTLPEWNDRQLAKLPLLRDEPAARETLRLAAVATRRRALERIPGM